MEYNKVGFPLTMRAFGRITKFVDGGAEHRVLFMHRVKLTGLIADQVYGRYWYPKNLAIPSKQRFLSCESLDQNIGVRVSNSFCINFTSWNSVEKCLFVACAEYHCGGLDGWSAIFSFKTFKPGVNWSPRLAVFGDLGSVNAKSLSYLQEETQRGHFDAILHVGEFYYFANFESHCKLLF